MCTGILGLWDYEDLPISKVLNKLKGYQTAKEIDNRYEWYRVKWLAQFAFVSNTDKRGFEAMQKVLNKPFAWEVKKGSKVTKEEREIIKAKADEYQQKKVRGTGV